MCLHKEKCADYDKDLGCDNVTCRWPTCYEKKDAANLLANEFTFLQNLKAILSDTCLKWAIQLLPDDSPEKKELSKFSIRYLKRSIDRRPVTNKASA